VAQHREDRYGLVLGGHRAVAPGPIAIEPTQPDHLVDAVLAGGGDLRPLSSGTKALVWASEKHPDDLLDILSRHSSIEWVQLPWSGVDAFASVLEWLSDRPEHSRPVVTSAKGAYSEPVAEHALTLLLSCLREIPRKAREARWQPVRTGLSLFGRHVVVVGAGGVARALIELLLPFGCEITVVRSDSSEPVEGAARTVALAQLADLLPSADAVVLAAAQTAQTRHVLGREELAALPAHAVVVNIARGPQVDTDALVWALGQGEIMAAGLDVTDPEPLPDDHPLFSLPNCVITSHSADTPEMTRPLLAARIRSNVGAYVAGEPLRGVVVPERGY
jgi:phosphoglycerate dehydrogenase-like enzyme